VARTITITHKLIEGSEEIVSSFDVTDDSKVAQDITVANGVTNQEIALTLDKDAVKYLEIKATQEMTMKTNGTDEVQTLTPAGTISGGTFTITYSAQTTAAIVFNATASAIQTALCALSNIDDTDGVVCAGGPINTTPVTITFKRSLAATNVAQITHTSSLTGGGTLTPSTTTAGVAVADTKTLYSEIPLDWHGTAGYHANPFSADITRLLVSNTSGASGTIYFRAIYDGTP
jgi:hypothetical protein